MELRDFGNDVSNEHMKEELLNDINREIRSSMNVVVGMAEMAMREDLTPNARSYITQIKASGEALLTFMEDEMSLYEAGRDVDDECMERYSVIEVINEVTDVIVTRAWEKNAELCVSIEPSIPNILFGHRRYLRQILLKLLRALISRINGGYINIGITHRMESGNDCMLTIDIVYTVPGTDIEDVDNISERELVIAGELAHRAGGELSTDSGTKGRLGLMITLPQTIEDGAPSAKLNNPDNIVVIDIFGNPVMADAISRDMEMLGVAAIGLGSGEGIGQMYDAIVSRSPNSEVFLFLEQSELTNEAKRLIQDHPELSAVMYTGLGANVNIEHRNLIAVSKPMNTVNTIKILNHDKVSGQIGYDDNAVADMPFTAPKARVLIVDDEPVNLLVAEGLLEPVGMDTVTASSGREALHMAGESHFDLIFMDYLMPELNGVETMKLIRDTYPEYASVPMIALTAATDSGMRELLNEAGMEDFISKPVEVKVLISKVRQWLPPEYLVYGEAVTGNGDERKRLFDRLHTAIDDLDSDAIDKIISELEGIKHDTEGSRLISLMREASDDVDIERCEAVLNEWESLLYGD